MKTKSKSKSVRSGDGLTGVQLIAAERMRQVEDEAWSHEHDDTHRKFELSQAGACYASAACVLNRSRFHRAFKAEELHPPMFEYLSWPWATKWWRPVEDPIRNLVKAGALIAAEIDRLQRLNAKTDNAEVCDQKP